MQSAVSIRGLSVRYGATDILKTLDLEIREGELIVLLGPSGCGKSTLLNAIAGLIEISDGEIWIAGENCTWREPKDRRIGMVFQSYALYPTMTVRRNLGFGLKMRSAPRARIEARVDEVAATLQLSSLLDRRPTDLSGGQRQRVAIGRALVSDAPIFLFDEPLSNLDAKLRHELRVEIKDLHQRLSKTMIYVTHDQVEAMALADRIAVMNGGIIEQLAHPSELYERPVNRFVAGFVGVPEMNFIDGELTVVEGAPRFVSGAAVVDMSAYPFAASPAPVGPAVLGIRPEHLALADPAGGRAVHAGTVTLVEALGADTMVRTELAGRPITIRTESRKSLGPGDAIAFAFDPAQASLFDAATGRRL